MTETVSAISSGVHSHVSVASGTDLVVTSGGTVAYVTVADGGELSLRGGVADTVTLASGAAIVLSAGTADAVTLEHGGRMVQTTGTVSELTIGGGAIDILNPGGGTLLDTVVLSAGTQEMLGGFTKFVTLHAGATQDMSGGIAVATIVSAGAGQRIVGGDAFITDISGGVLAVSGGEAYDTVLHRGEVALLGGTTYQTFISGGAAEDVYGGTALSTRIYASGVQDVDGGLASATDVYKGGIEYVRDGTDRATTLDGGTQFAEGGVVSGITVLHGGTQQVLGATVVGGTLADGTQDVAGGSAGDVTVGYGGAQYVSSGAVVAATTIEAGGSAVVFAGGASVVAIVVSGGRLMLSAGATTSTMLQGGVEQVEGGTASATVVSAGGTQTVAAGTADATVIAGGTLVALAGGALSGITFGGAGGTLKLDTPSMPGGAISGFTFGDTIDLAQYAFASGATATIDSATDRLTVSAGGTTETLQLAGGYTSASFKVIADGGSGVDVEQVVCFLPGTHIATPAGEVPVESLRPGDLVTTISRRHRPLRWIGFGRTLISSRNRDRATPVVVRKHALGEYVPHRDLYITRGHSLFIDGVLIPVEELINHRSIAWVEEAKVVEYYHLELDSHDVVIAEGAAAETFRDDGNSAVFLNAAARPPTPPCAPVLHDHPTVKRIWRRLSDRAGRLEFSFSDDPDLHLRADDARIDAREIAGRIWHFRLPRAAREIRIVSRSAIPSMIGLAQDQRRLGVALRRIELIRAGRTRRFAWDSPALAHGFHAPEPAERHRWTDGHARLPTKLPAGTRVVLHVAATLPYPVEDFSAAA